MASISSLASANLIVLNSRSPGDLWGVVYKIDARSGDVGRIAWRMDPGQEKVPDANRSKQIERNESDLVMADPVSGEVKKRIHSIYPNTSGVLTTAGGLVFTAYTDGTFEAYDDNTLDRLWRINVGTGFNAPPITFEAGRRQYVGILSGISNITKGRHVLTPELREQRDQTMLFVFGL